MSQRPDVDKDTVSTSTALAAVAEVHFSTTGCCQRACALIMPGDGVSDRTTIQYGGVFRYHCAEPNTALSTYAS